MADDVEQKKGALHDSVPRCVECDTPNGPFIDWRREIYCRDCHREVTEQQYAD